MLIRGKRNELCFNCKFVPVQTSNILGNLADSLLTNGISNLLWMDDLTSDILIQIFFLSAVFSLVLLHTPADTGGKLNVHKTFKRRPGRLLNVLCTFNLRLVSTGIFTSPGGKKISSYHTRKTASCTSETQ